MSSTVQLSTELIHKLLRSVSVNRADKLDTLLAETAPIFLMDSEVEQNLFLAKLGNPNIIKCGLKCSIRLQAHAYAAGVICSAFGTIGFETMAKAEREVLLAPADPFLTWAVGLDLQRELAKRNILLSPDLILPGGISSLPDDLLKSLNSRQRILGEGLFRYATAFILLHEIGHLKFKHSESTYENEKFADRFAAEWLSEAAFSSSSENMEGNRLSALLGIAVALLWLTVFNFYFGMKKSKSHPEGYDRLYQVLEQVIDQGNEDEHKLVWWVVATLLFIHMDSAGFDFDIDFDAARLQGSQQESANYLIDRIANWDRKRTT